MTLTGRVNDLAIQIVIQLLDEIPSGFLAAMSKDHGAQLGVCGTGFRRQTVSNFTLPLRLG